MTSLLIVALSSLAVLSVQAAVTCGPHGDRTTMLVSTGWLATHLHDPGLVVIGVGVKTDFDKAHIPGAVFLDLPSISAKGSALTLELPPPAELNETFRALGVSNNSRIILYTAGNSIQSTTRVYMTLDSMGLGRNTSLLDGGFAAWQQENRAVSSDPAAPKHGNVEACLQSDVIVDSAFVAASLRKPGIDIVDARLPAFYTGEQIPTGQRAGHIPGAANVPYSSTVDESGKLKSPEALTELFRAAGIKPGDRVVSYCHIGQQATVIYFVARYLGYDARLYDGSWQDWSGRKDLPVETSPKQ